MSHEKSAEEKAIEQAILTARQILAAAEITIRTWQKQDFARYEGCRDPHCKKLRCPDEESKADWESRLARGALVRAEKTEPLPEEPIDREKAAEAWREWVEACQKTIGKEKEEQP